MPFCPDCKAEYLEGEEICEDCQVPLVEILTKEEKAEDDDIDLVEVWVATNEIEAQMIKVLLEGNRIECILSGESLRHTHGIMVDGLAEVKIIVRAEEASRAEALIAEYMHDQEQ
jgi:hypothetical protein